MINNNTPKWRNKHWIKVDSGYIDTIYINNIFYIERIEKTDIEKKDTQMDR